jgi:hypothetical protein
VTYQTYEEERESDQRFEAHQERLAQEADEQEDWRKIQTHRFGLDDVCEKCGLHSNHCLDECDPPEVMRTNQKALECYVVGADSDEPDTVFVVASDGVGRHFFDTELEALLDFGADTPVHYVETADE